MFDKLEDLLIRYEEVMGELQDPVLQRSGAFPQADERTK